MIHIMLPVYNEAHILPDLLDSIRAVDWADGDTYTVVVVDDGSSDATVSVCRSRWDLMPLEVSCHITRQGVGAAMLTGLKHCLSRCGSDDVVVSMQCGSASSCALMPSMARRIRSGSDVVIASRYAPGGGELCCPGKTRIRNCGANGVLRIVFGIPGVRDYTSGYHAYSAPVLEWGFDAFSDTLIEQKGSACMAELLVKLASLGVTVSEAPLVLHYEDSARTGELRGADRIGSYLKLMTINRPRVPAEVTLAEVGRLGGSTPKDIEE